MPNISLTIYLVKADQVIEHNSSFSLVLLLSPHHHHQEVKQEDKLPLEIKLSSTKPTLSPPKPLKISKKTSKKLILLRHWFILLIPRFFSFFLFYLSVPFPLFLLFKTGFIPKKNQPISSHHSSSPPFPLRSQLIASWEWALLQHPPTPNG